MSHGESHEHSHSEPATSSVFTPEECAAMHQDDIQAAKGVVCLMTGVFILGLVIYTVVAYICAS